MACSFPYIEKNFRKSNPEVADKLNQVGLDTWTEIKDSKLFTQKEGSFVFNKQGTIKREKQNQLVNSINEKLGGNVVTESDKKVSVNLSPIFGRYEQIIPLVTPTEMVLETPTVSAEPITPKVDVVKLEWDEYEKILQNPENVSIASLALITKFKGYDSLQQYKDVMGGDNPQAFTEYADNKLYQLLKDFTDTIGVGILDIADYQKSHFDRTGKIISAAGVADLINKTIYVTNGNLDALTEEVAHFIVAMLPKNNSLFQALDAYLENTPEYYLYYSDYLDKYAGNEGKTRDEIMGKVIKNVFQSKKEKTPLSLKTLINSILDYINSLFSNKKLEYNQATASIKQMFFAQNLVENLSDLDTANKEMYQLAYDLLKDETKLNTAKNSDIIDAALDKTFENVVISLETFAKKAQQTGNIRGLQTANSLLLKIKNNVDENIDKDALFVEVQKTISKGLNGINQSFGILQKDNINSLTSLFAKGGDYSPAEMAKLQNEEYYKRLKQLGSYISYIQNLKDFALNLQELRDIVSTIESSNETYKQIIATLNPNLANNGEFIQSMALMTSAEITDKVNKINAAYNTTSEILVRGILNATTTADQRDYMEKTGKTFLPMASDLQEDTITNQETNKDKLSWVKNLFRKVEQSVAPTSMQSDVFLQNVNSFVNFVTKKAQEQTFKEEAQLLELQQELGNVNQEFLSSKDEKGNLTFELLSKFNYTTYSKEKSKYLLDEVVSKLIDNPRLIDAKEFLIDLKSKPFISTKQIKGAIADAYFPNEVLSEEDFNYIDSYIDASENLYNLKRFVPSTGLSDVAKEGVESYIETAKKVYEEALSNNNFNWGADTVEDVLSSEIDVFELYPAVMEKIEERQKLLEKQYYTFDPETTDIETNIPFKNQYYRVQGLLNMYKSSLGYVEDEGGLFNPTLIKVNRFGEQYLFDLSGESVDGIPATYIDEDYKKLEEEAKDENNANYKEATAKLKIIQFARERNKVNNNPINSLPSYPKRSSEYNTIKFFGNRVRISDLVTRLAIPTSLAIYVTPGMLTGDWSLVNQLDNFIALPLIQKGSSFLINIAIANQLMRAISITTENFSRDISSIKDAKNIINSLLKSIGMTSSAFNLEMTREEENAFPEYDSENKILNWFKKSIDRISNFFVKQNKDSVNINFPYTPKAVNLIPQWTKNKLPAALRSTQFIDNIAQDIAATNDYNAKVDFEGALKAMDDSFRERSKTIPSVSNFIENAYLNRVWYGKIASKNAFRKMVNTVTRLTSKMFLTGNILTDIKNLFQGYMPLIIKGGPLLTGKSGVKAFIYSFDMMINAVKNDKMAVESNFIQQIKKRMRLYQPSGIAERNTGQSVIARKLRLDNERLTNALGESFISSTIVHMMLEDNKLVDETGKKYDLAKYAEVREGSLKLKKDAPKAYFNFITREQASNLPAEDLIKITPTSVNVSTLSDKGKASLTPTNIAVENYLNSSFLDKLEYFTQKSQGVYNTLDKPLLATTAVGHAVYMFGNHLVSNYKTSLGARKYNVNTGETETGFILGSLFTLKDLLQIAISSPFRTEAMKKFLAKNKEYDNKKSNVQLTNLEEYISITNKGLVDDLFSLSAVFGHNWIAKDIEKLAKDIYEGKIAPKFNENKEYTQDDILKILYFAYLSNRQLNAYKAKSLKALATSILLGTTMYKVATILLARAVGGDDEDVSDWQRFLAYLNQTLSVEMFINYTGFGLLQKLGFNFKEAAQQKIYGKGAQNLGISPKIEEAFVSSGFVGNIVRDLVWAISAFNYNKFGKKSLIFYDDKQEKVIIKVTKGEDLPYFRPQYVIKTKPSGKKGKPGKSRLVKPPINMVKQEILDAFFTPTLRDVYKVNPLKTDYYKKLPSSSLDLFNMKLEKGYIRQTGGRELIEDLSISKEQFKEIGKP